LPTYPAAEHRAASKWRNLYSLIMKFIITLLTTAASLWVAVWLVDGIEFSGAWWQFLIVAIVIGFANAIAKPIITFFSLPFIVITLGLFLFVVNALVFQLVVWLSGPSVLDLGLTSTGFFWATFWGSVVISVVGWILGFVLPDGD
jgi:putative membrane protein